MLSFGWSGWVGAAVCMIHNGQLLSCSVSRVRLVCVVPQSGATRTAWSTWLSMWPSRAPSSRPKVVAPLEATGTLCAVARQRKAGTALPDTFCRDVVGCCIVSRQPCL
jgi:hypothetical protein